MKRIIALLTVFGYGESLRLFFERQNACGGYDRGEYVYIFTDKHDRR